MSQCPCEELGPKDEVAGCAVEDPTSKRLCTLARNHPHPGKAHRQCGQDGHHDVYVWAVEEETSDDPK